MASPPNRAEACSATISTRGADWVTSGKRPSTILSSVRQDARLRKVKVRWGGGNVRHGLCGKQRQPPAGKAGRGGDVRRTTYALAPTPHPAPLSLEPPLASGVRADAADVRRRPAPRPSGGAL